MPNVIVRGGGPLNATVAVGRDVLFPVPWGPRVEGSSLGPVVIPISDTRS